MVPSRDLAVSGTAFGAMLGAYSVRFYFPDLGKNREVPYDRIKMMEVQNDGRVKIRVRLGRDLVVPTSRVEAVGLTGALNASMEELRSMQHRRSRAATHKIYPYGLFWNKT